MMPTLNVRLQQSSMKDKFFDCDRRRRL